MNRFSVFLVALVCACSAATPTLAQELHRKIECQAGGTVRGTPTRAKGVLEFTVQLQPSEAVCSGDKYLENQAGLDAALAKLINDYFLGQAPEYPNRGVSSKNVLYSTGATACSDSWYHYAHRVLFLNVPC